MPPAALAEMKNEVRLWTPLKNEGVVRLLFATLDPVPLLVLEACNGGTLFGAIRCHTLRFQLVPTVWCLLAQPWCLHAQLSSVVSVHVLFIF